MKISGGKTIKMGNFRSAMFFDPFDLFQCPACLGIAPDDKHHKCGH